MSAAPQLDFDCFRGDEKAAKKKREPVTRVTCKCGHHQSDHANRRHTGACANCRGECKRFCPKSKPPVEQPAHLAPPNGAIILERDDTKRAMAMGWAIFEEFPGSNPGHGAPHGERPRGERQEGLLPSGANSSLATIYLAQLKTKSLNENFFGGSKHDAGESAAVIKSRIRQRFAWQGAYKDACRERTISAIAQLGADVAARGRPTSIVVTRVSPRTLDKHDNVRGALKYVVDGIAEALGFNDSELEDSAARAGGQIGIRYEQEKSGVARVCGVRIQITWKGTST